jgi:hypothetical protein
MMASRSIGGAASLVRSWTWLYTCGLPTAVRHFRRAEIESDLWEFFHDPDRVESVSSSAHLVVRLLRGVPDDLTWRAEHVAAGHQTLAFRLFVATLVAAVTGTAAFMFDIMRARQLPKPPPITRHFAYPFPLRVSPTSTLTPHGK